MPNRSARKAAELVLSMTLVAVSCFSCGCQDGPLYAIKHVNPYFALHEWKADQQVGITDHQRRQELAALVDDIHNLPRERQEFWGGQLNEMLANDPSPEMRRLAVQAVRRLDAAIANPIITAGLDDESMKVRMEACRVLGQRPGDDYARMLATTVGTDTSDDVKHAAMAALGQHQSSVAVDSLRIALSDRNPATRQLAMESLRGSTGKNYGDDPQVWIAALEGKPTEEVPVRFADRAKQWF